MNVTQNNIDAVNATLLVTVSNADYAEKVNKAIKDFCKKANMPGFRKGCVPAGLVKKMYGKGLLAEEVNKLVSNSLYDYIKDNNLNILGEPLPTEGFAAPSLVEGEDFTFSFDIALAPEVKVEWNGSVPYYTIDVDQTLIDKQVAAYRGRYGKYVQADAVEEKDVIKGELVELNEDGSVKEDGIKVENAMLSPNYMKDSDEKAKVLGVAKEASFVFNPAKAYVNEAEIASLLQIKAEEAKEFTANCQFTVKEITRFAEAEMNQEFFDASFGKDTVKTEEEFYAKIKEGLQEQFVADSDIKFVIDLREYALNQLKDVQFADATLKRWLKLNNEKMTDEEIAAEYPKMIEDLKWQMVKDGIAKENNVKLEKEDIEAVAKRSAKAQFAQYGMLNVPEDILANYVEEMLKDQNGARNAAERASENKVVAIIKEKVSIENKTVSFDEFNKFFEGK
jgi:trigger factor